VAFALYVDQQAGTGPNAPIDRIVPLPHLSQGHGIDFRNRRLTLSYDNNLIPNAPATVTVTGRFLPAPGSPINVTVNAGECQVVDVPPEACAASLHVNPAQPGTARGPLTALVEYSD